MGKASLRFALLLLVAGLLAYGLVRQHLSGNGLQTQLVSLRAQAATAAQLKTENARLRAALPSPEELAGLRRAQMRSAPYERDAPPAASGHPRLEAGRWKLAGRATPAKAFESVLWAATHGDIDALTGILGIDPKARKKAEAMFASLPEETREKYGSPERIAATMLAANTPSNLSAIDTLGTTGNADQATLLMRVERDDGTQKDNFFKFQHEPEGWKLIVPSYVLRSYASQLAGRTALPTAAAPAVQP